MGHPRREWSIDDLFVLSQYPTKTLAQLAKELGAATTTIRRELLRMGKKMHKSGRGVRTVALAPAE
jgi:hypothetical protein